MNLKTLLVGLFQGMMLYALIKIVAEIFDIMLGSYWLLAVYVVATIILSFINIPLYRTKEADRVGINVGGCIMPFLLSVYFLYEVRSVLATIIVAMIITMLVIVAIAWKTSFYVKGKGVMAYAMVVPAATTFAVYLLTFGVDATNNLLYLRLSLGYAIGTFATIFGADVCNMSKIGKDLSCGDRMNMGGAGILDGVWLTGIMTMVLVFATGHLFGTV